MSPYFRAKEEALKHRAVKDDDDDDVAKSIEIMVWKKKRAVLFVRDDDDKNDKNEIKKQVLRVYSFCTSAIGRALRIALQDPTLYHDLYREAGL